MIKFLIIIIIILLPHCSFDNKTGIWKNNNTADFKKEDKFKDFKTLYSKKKTFDKIIKIIITENNFFFFLITPATFSNKFGLSMISFSI